MKRSRLGCLVSFAVGLGLPAAAGAIFDTAGWSAGPFTAVATGVVAGSLVVVVAAVTAIVLSGMRDAAREQAERRERRERVLAMTHDEAHSEADRLFRIPGLFRLEPASEPLPDELCLGTLLRGLFRSWAVVEVSVTGLRVAHADVKAAAQPGFLQIGEVADGALGTVVAPLGGEATELVENGGCPGRDPLPTIYHLLVYEGRWAQEVLGSEQRLGVRPTR